MNRTEKLIIGCMVAVLLALGAIAFEIHALTDEIALPRRQEEARRLIDSQEELKRAQERARH